MITEVVLSGARFGFGIILLIISLVQIVTISPNISFAQNRDYIAVNNIAITTNLNNTSKVKTRGRYNFTKIRNRKIISKKINNLKKNVRKRINVPKPTRTPTRTPTPRPTRTPTRTPTPRPTKTPTRTPTPRTTQTPTRTPTIKPTPTVRPTNSPTRTPIPITTSTPTIVFTNTPVPTNTPIATPLPIYTTMSILTPTPVATNTKLPTAIPTSTPTPTRTSTIIPTATVAPTKTALPLTSTPTPTRTLTPTVTPMPSPTRTLIPFPTPTRTISLSNNTQPSATPTILPAFPGAQGNGAQTKHGRGGLIIPVTTLADSGVGSLREALENVTGSRIVIFKVGGRINLVKPIVIKNPYIMIAGQSAPGDGIMITGHQLIISTHDVVIRYLRFRPDGMVQGDAQEIDGIEIWPNHPWNPYEGAYAYNIVVDHCSVSWASDENISTNGLVRDVTFQWNIVSEGLHQLAGYGRGIILSPLSERISIHHNLLAHNPQRNPLSRGATSFDFRNNVVYNWKYAGTHLQNGWEPYHNNNTSANIVGNYFKQGPDLANAEVKLTDPLGANTKIYVSGNIGPRRSSDNMDDWLITSNNGNWWNLALATFKILTPFNFANVTTTTANTAYTEVLANAGARLPKLDVVDTRIINETLNGTGKVLQVNVEEVGGYPTMSSGTTLPDTDNDGIPDSFEISNGLNHLDSDDGNLDKDNDGYTNIEEYLNGTTL
jgi:pectate lyase